MGKSGASFPPMRNAPPAPYRPCPTERKPVTLCTLKNRRAQVVDAWQWAGELWQVWRDRKHQLWLGPADAEYHTRAFWPIIKEEEPVEEKPPYRTEPAADEYIPPRQQALAALTRTGLLVAKLHPALEALSARPGSHPDREDAATWVQMAGDMHRASEDVITALVEMLTDEITALPTKSR